MWNIETVGFGLGANGCEHKRMRDGFALLSANPFLPPFSHCLKALPDVPLVYMNCVI